MADGRRTKDRRRGEARLFFIERGASEGERFHIIVTWPTPPLSHEGEEEKRLMLPRNFGRRLLGTMPRVCEREERAQRRYLGPEPIFVSDSGQR